MRWVQQRFWPTAQDDSQQVSVRKLQGALIAVALVVGLVLAFFPTTSFINDVVETPYYIIPKAEVMP